MSLDDAITPEQQAATFAAFLHRLAMEIKRGEVRLVSVWDKPILREGDWQFGLPAVLLGHEVGFRYHFEARRAPSVKGSAREVEGSAQALELARCAEINLQNMVQMMPALRLHPLLSIVEAQLRECVQIMEALGQPAAGNFKVGGPQPEVK